MNHWFIEFDEDQDGNEHHFDDSMLGFVHICLASNNDYTLCGHATDEYNTKTVNKKPTCRNCIRFVKDCQSIKIKCESDEGKK